MYYYVLDGGSYEEYYKSVFRSKTKYSKEEFMDLIKKTFKHCCSEKVKEDSIKKYCDYFLTVESHLWSEDFNKYLEEISDLRYIEGDEVISVGTDITPNKNTRKIRSILNELNIPDCRNSCECNLMLKEFNCFFEGE